MKIKISPLPLTDNFLTVPASKSYSHRAIIAASLAQGKSEIKNIMYSVDVLATIEAMKALGAKINKLDNELEIWGINNKFTQCDSTIDCHESGSTLRFLIPILTMVNHPTTLTGSVRLFQRPLNIYQDIFQKQNLLFEQNNNQLNLFGKLKGQKYYLSGSISSQFITGLMFVLPLLEHDSEIIIEPPFESESYVNLTIQTLKAFNIEISKEGLSFKIKGCQKYLATDYEVEADYSQASFFLALGALKYPLVLNNLDRNSLQGDRQILDILQELGVEFDFMDKQLNIRPTNINQLITIDLENCPDLGPILMVLACFNKQTTTIINAGRLRIKESDRIAAMEQELGKCQAIISSTKQTITITPQNNYQITQEIFSHNDHRIVMAMAIFALVLNQPIIISQAEAINKSYPTFFNDLEKLGVVINEVV